METECAVGGAPERTRQFKGVQALRFLAAFSVVVGHATFYTRERLDPSVRVWTFTTVGVDIFFVISGFVMIISSQSLISRRDGWKFFVVRRAVRIVPMYWIATTAKLVTMILLPGAVLHVVLNWTDVSLSYFFIPSRNLDGNVQPLLGVGWTLVFEVFFYALFTVSLALRVRPLLFCSAALAALSVGYLFRPATGWNPLLVYLDPIVLYFLVGMIIGQFVIDRSRRALIIRILGVVGLLATIWLIRRPTSGVFGQGQLIRALTVIALLLVGVLLETRVQSRIPRWLLFMGDASYTLYLFHPLIAPIVPAALEKVGLFNGPLSILVCILVSLSAAIVIHRIIERPLTRLLQNRLPYIKPHRIGELEESVSVAAPHVVGTPRDRPSVQKDVVPSSDGLVD